MSLTVHQGERLEMALIEIQKHKRVLISGSAGVGKTYLVDELLKRLAVTIPSYKKIFCSAPTNKAVAVLKGKVSERPNLEFITTHAGLKIKRKIDFKTGAVSFKPAYSDSNPPLKGVGIICVDETSMIPTEMLLHLEEHAKRTNCVIIFIGDKKQLNPVGEESSPVFLGQPHVFKDEMAAMEFHNKNEGSIISSYLKDTIVYIPYPEVELTEIIRQGEGNPIIDLSRNLSRIGDKVDNMIGDKGYLYSDYLAQVIETLAAVNGTDELKYLAWTNKDVAEINKKVRVRLYGEIPAKIEKEETLVFNEPYAETYYTNQEFKVAKIEVGERDFEYPVDKERKGFETTVITKPVKLKYYSINSGKEDAPDVFVVHEDSEKNLERVLKHMKHLCTIRSIDWVDFYAFKESFADLTYNHAITVHKSQGSTYKQVIVNVQNLSQNRKKVERERLVYTAITRASDLVILYKS